VVPFGVGVIAQIAGTTKPPTMHNSSDERGRVEMGALHRGVLDWGCGFYTKSDANASYSYLDKINSHPPHIKPL